MKRSMASFADAVEQTLSNAARDGQPFSAACIAQHDRREQCPEAACQLLNVFGLAAYYVPVGHGGKLESFSELVQLLRAVARRDLTTAVAHGKTFLGAACVWVAADPTQAQWLAQEIVAGSIVSWGLTERHHGSDLLASEFTASKHPHGWLVNGEKWPINNATRGQVLCALAQTDPAGGPRGFSLLLMDKRELVPGSYRCLPKEATHGIRGADISGIAYHDAVVPHGALVGTVGEGLEVVLKALQMTRTVCAALSLGAADHAFELALRFASERQMYGRRLLDLPLVRRTLGEAAATLLVAETVSEVASRCITTLPGEMSVVSAVTKAFVPSVIDELIASLGDLLGARAFLTGVFEHGMYQKIERDHRIVAIFDGSTVVNRNSVINQFGSLSRLYDGQTCDREGLAVALDARAPLPPFAPGRLRLVSNTGCSVLQALPQAVVELGQIQGARRPTARALRMADAVQEAASTLIQECCAYRPSSRDVPPEAFDLARRYELCFAGAACIGYWVANHRHVREEEGSTALWDDALWLESALVRIVHQLTPTAPQLETDMESYDLLIDRILVDGPRRVSALIPHDE